MSLDHQHGSRLEPVNQDTSVESEKKDVSLMTGPAWHPFGRASIYGGCVKMYFMKSEISL